MRTAAVQLTIRDNLIDYIGTFSVSIGTCLFRHTNDGFIFALYLTYMQPSTFKHKVSIEGVCREGFITAHDPVKPTNRLSD